jgi:hypothetical protein
VRALLDAFLGFSVAANAVILALSLGGYGLGRLAPWRPHLPVEFAAMALALATYNFGAPGRGGGGGGA